MGRVWRATDVVLHREVAIKELVPPPGLTPDERREMRERSLREARAIARLNNINVVRVFDVLRTDADPWIVMEYVPSRSLQDALASDGPFPPVRVAEIGLGVLNALRAARNAGLYVPRETVERCIKYVKQSQNPDGGFKYMLQGGPSGFPRSAAGVVALYSAAVYDAKEVDSGINYLKRLMPEIKLGQRSPHYFYGHYYAAQAMWIRGKRPK